MIEQWNQHEWKPPSRDRVPLRFPRIIHLMWLPTLDKLPSECAEQHELWQRLNPEWKVMRWDESSIIRLMNGFIPDLIPTFREIKLPIKKADFARIVVLLKYGGLYVDYDLVPSRPLDCFFSDPFILAQRNHHAGSVPRFVSRIPVDWSKCDLILTREYRPIDKFTAVANGVMFSAPEHSDLSTFLYKQAPKHQDEYVLDYLGPHALTRHLRSTIDMASTAILPPYYFIWEDRAFDHPAPPWVVSRHLAKSNWANTWKEGNPLEVI